MKLISFLLISFFFFNCKSESKTIKEKITEKSKSKVVFPTLKNISDLQKTDFIPALESQFSKGKNNIYSATFPIVWNKIKEEIKFPINNIESPSLALLNTTETYKNVLKRDEFRTKVEIEGVRITAEAYFQKSLPFPDSLRASLVPLKFSERNVKSFGHRYDCEFSKINYYHSDSDFSISLLPEDDEHEIILILTEKTKNSFREYFDEFRNNFAKRNNLKRWKLHFNHGDKVEIPVIEFNLEKNYLDIEKTKFTSKNQVFEVFKAYQQNAFILNEKGAIVESESVMAVDAAAESGDEEQHPKLMVFNNPFVVFLKRKDAEFPYFAVFVQNEEILKVVN